MAHRIVALANQKGGVGKTTTAVNLAACLTAHRMRVLLVDLDPQANATSGLGLEKTEGGSAYAALLGEEPLAARIVPTAYARLDMVPSEVDLAGAEVDIARSDRYLHRLREALSPLCADQRFDYILVDCPPSLGILTMNALTAAEELLIPMQCEYYALEGLGVMSRLVDRLRRSGANPELRIEGIVLTMYDGRTNLTGQVAREVAAHFPDQLYKTVIPRSVRVSEAPSHGRPVIDYDGRSTGAEAYRQLAREFLRRRRPPAPAPGAPPAEPAAESTPPAEPAPREETPPGEGTPAG